VMYLLGNDSCEQRFVRLFVVVGLRQRPARPPPTNLFFTLGEYSGFESSRIHLANGFSLPTENRLFAAMRNSPAYPIALDCSFRLHEPRGDDAEIGARSLLWKGCLINLGASREARQSFSCGGCRRLCTRDTIESHEFLAHNRLIPLSSGAFALVMCLYPSGEGTEKKNAGCVGTHIGKFGGRGESEKYFHSTFLHSGRKAPKLQSHNREPNIAISSLSACSEWYRIAG
jgi:hypothetical protein